MELDDSRSHDNPHLRNVLDCSELERQGCKEVIHIYIANNALLLCNQLCDNMFYFFQHLPSSSGRCDNLK